MNQPEDWGDVPSRRAASWSISATCWRAGPTTAGSRRCIASSIRHPTAAESRRQSLVFFHNPNYDAVVACLPSCTAPNRPPKYPPTTSGEASEEAISAYASMSVSTPVTKPPISRFPTPELADLPQDIRERIEAVQEKSGLRSQRVSGARATAGRVPRLLRLS